MTRHEICEELEDTDLFAGLKHSELCEIVSECRLKRWEKSEAIDNDEGIEYFNIVVKGSVKLMHTDPHSGRSIVLFLLKRGDVFDILSLLDGEAHVSNPIAVETVDILRAPMATARRWLERYPEFNERFLPYIGKQMRILENFAESVVFDDTATRLAKLILKHADTKNRHDEEEYPVKIINNLSHELLAEMIGSVRSVVTTQLQKLKKDEIILQKRGYLAVKKLEELKRRYNL
ncbi:Crp/Fnr family transcriptional regulator [Hydrogenimonas cancrithermarum]|uniref:Crp/Fnr family transcriptional regulator n=1 Tax=Hydrogenimonas cancrithermarum TaxID=2993563 RepID=A0ABM8FJH6_9BACT|nr:Crp/Fnr family transcriptional regulator [Hydrogenimonas cancrithermarum]BDY11769.1 Crp/Fnr family transcriptional regulator [Hydrogenimonas cancrithermarum]